MRTHLAEFGELIRNQFPQRLGHELTEERGGASIEECQLQVQALRSRVRELEQTLSEARRNEAALREKVAQSRSSFAIAWSDFAGEPTIEDRLSTLDPGDSRARRWLLTP